MSSIPTSATSPGTAAVDASVGSVAWANINNILASDNSRATAALNNTVSQYAKATNFGFAIPSGSTIEGVMVEVERSKTTGTGTITDNSIRLVRAGVIAGKDLAATDTWPGADAYASYGGFNEAWGLSWGYADINDAQFGVVVSAKETASSSATAGIDHIRITVWYTDAYEASPEVQDDNTIRLYGHAYRTRGPVHVTMATQYPGKVVIGEFTKNDTPYLSDYTVEDLRGGMGLLRYPGDASGDRNRFWTARNMNTFWANAITLGPLITSLGNIAAETTHYASGLAVFGASGGDTNVVNIFTNVYTHNGTSWVTPKSATLLSDGTLGIVAFNGRLFYAAGASGYSYLTSAISATTDVVAPTAMSFVVWDDKLYAMDRSGVLYSSTTGDAASWTTLATLPEVAAASPRFDLVVYVDASGDPTIWCATHAGVWTYDAVNDKWFRVQFTYPNINAGSVIRVVTTYQGLLYLQTSARKVYSLDYFNRITVQDVSPGLPDGPPAEYVGTSVDDTRFPAAFAASDQWLFLLTNAMGTPSDNGTIGVLAYNGQGWHPLVLITGFTFSGNVPSAIGISNTTAGYRLYFADNVGSLAWINLATLSLSPLVSTTQRYATSGSVELPWYDSGYESQTKTAIRLKVKVQGLATASETVRIDYSTDFGTTYTQLGSTITSATAGIVGGRGEVTLNFGTNNRGLAFRSIRFKITLASAGSTNAPKVEYISLGFQKNPEVLRGFAVQLDMSDVAPDGRSPRQQIEDLWTAIASPTLGTFAHRDDSGNTRSYMVRALNPSGNEQTGLDEAGSYSVFLHSFGANV